MGGAVLSSSLHREENNIMSQQHVAILHALSIIPRVKTVLVSVGKLHPTLRLPFQTLTLRKATTCGSSP